MGGDPVPGKPKYCKCSPGEGDLPPENGLKVAFLGDSGAGDEASRLYRMLSDEGVQLVLQNGDLDYNESPSQWDHFLDSNERGMSVLVTSGNHEEEDYYDARWYGTDGYKARMKDRNYPLLERSCSGDYGERYSCTVGEVFFVMLGWKQTDDSSEISKSNDYLEQQLSSSNAAQKWCVWHQPEGRLNPSDTHTRDYGFMQLYDTCRRHGAPVTNGHSHVYSRTKVIDGFSPNRVSVSDGDKSTNPTLNCGESITFVLGMSGYKFDSDGPYAGESYFRKTYSRSQNNMGDTGALICVISGSKAQCSYKTTEGKIVDSFSITSACSDGSSAPPPPPPPSDGSCDSMDNVKKRCGKCKVLADNFANYRTCDNYCTANGLRCVGAWEESSNSCDKIKKTMKCRDDIHNIFGGTSDAICECKESASSTLRSAVPPPPADEAVDNSDAESVGGVDDVLGGVDTTILVSAASVGGVALFAFVGVLVHKRRSRGLDAARCATSKRCKGRFPSKSEYCTRAAIEKMRADNSGVTMIYNPMTVAAPSPFVTFAEPSPCSGNVGANDFV